MTRRRRRHSNLAATVVVILACPLLAICVGTRMYTDRRLIFVAALALVGFVGLVIIVNGVRIARYEADERQRQNLLLSMNYLHALGPYEFEQYVEALLTRRGYRVRRVGGVGDGGVDLYIDNRDGVRAVVQCKHRSKPDEGGHPRPVGPEVVRQLAGSMLRESVTEGYLVANTTFTRGAREEARALQGYTIHLIDLDGLTRAASQ